MVRLIARPVSYERSLGIAFEPIRHFGGDNPAIVQRVLRAYVQLAGIVPSTLHGILQLHVDAVLRQARQRIVDRSDLLAIELIASTFPTTEP
jgi:uncharacterized membrane protein